MLKHRILISPASQKQKTDTFFALMKRVLTRIENNLARLMEVVWGMDKQTF